MAQKKEVEISVEVKHKTQKGLLVTDGDIDTWLPRSQIKDTDSMNIGDTYNINVPEWLAKDKGLI